MKKNLINEDISKMMNLIGYDRGKTLTENKKSNKEQLLNEIYSPAVISGILAAAGLGYLTIKNAPTIFSGIKTFGSRAYRMMGAVLNDIKMEKVLNMSTWANINKTFNDLEAAFEVQKGYLRTKIEFIGANATREIASSLEDDMTGVDVLGAGERNVLNTYKRIPSVFDAIGVSAAFGIRKRENLIQWLEGDYISFDSLEKVLKGKTYITFDGKDYKDLKSATVAMVVALKKKSKSDEINKKGTDEAGMSKDKEEMVAILVAKFGECVRGPLERGTVKYHPKSGRRNIRVKEGGEDIAVFDNGEFWDAKAPTGKKYVRGKTVLQPCEETTEAVVAEHYYFGSLSEQLKVKDADGNVRSVGDAPTPKPEDSSSSDEKKKSSGGGSKWTRTDVTYEDVAAGKGEFKKGDRGDEVKKAQEALNKSDKVNPKLKVDGYFGGKTEAAIKQVGGDKVVNKALIAMLGGKPDDDTAGEEEQKQADAQASQMSDAEVLKFVEENKVKELDRKACKKLMSTTAQMIKKRPNDPKTKENLADAQLKTTLGNCFNDNLVDFGFSGRRVRKAFGLKQKGN